MQKYKEEILSEIKKTETELEKDPMIVLEKVKGYDYGDLYHNQIKDKYKPDYNEYDKFINKLYTKYLDIVFESLKKTGESSLRERIREYALRFRIILNNSPVLMDTCFIILARLRDDESFKILLAESEKILETETDEYVNNLPLICLLKLYEVEMYRKQIKDFLLGSYDHAREYALKNRKYDYLGDNLNSDIFLVISQGILSLGKEDREEFADTYFKAYQFACAKERDYSMHQVSGYMAIYLTAFSKLIDGGILDKCLSTTGKNYQENKFVFQTRYAKWYLEKNSSAAVDFLKENKCYDQLGYIAALISDLNYKIGLPILEEKLKEITVPVTVEIFLEAIDRLKSQQNAPDPEKRMIWLFGTVSATQRALGAGSDDIFLERAKKKTKIDDHVYETDDE